jgi:parallel beta-helix repeat protein
LKYRISILLIGIFIFSWLSTTPVQADSLHKSGTLSADETWTADNIYIIDSSLTIASGVTLTIQAGTVVKVMVADIAIIVNGRLDAQGTSSNPVVFTSYWDDSVGGDTNGDGGANSPGPGMWEGIQINNSASTLQYSVIRYAFGGIMVNKSSPTIANDVITDNEEAILVFTGSPILDHNQLHDNSTGVYLDDASPSITNNDFSNNGVHLEYYGNANPTYSGNTFSATGGGMIELDGDAITGEVTWQNVQGLNWPYYYMYGSLSINPGATLHLAAGTIIKMHSGMSITVNGILDSQGTDANPVIFTSYRDDSVGGDTDEDGGANSPAAGDWAGIQLLNSANTLQNTTIRYASTAISVANSVSPTISHNLLSNNATAINVSSGAPAITANSFANNTAHLSQSVNASPTYAGNTFSGAGGQMIHLSDSTLTGTPTWSSQPDLPYFIGGDLTINAGAVLHLPAGTVVKAWQSSIIVNGILDSQGTDSNPVVFTSYKDDSYGGDTNGDGSASSPFVQDWDGIQIYNSANALQFSFIHYAFAGIYVASSSPAISNNTLTDNYTAFYISSGSPSIDHNQISQNYYGVFVMDASPTFTNNNFLDNITHLDHFAVANPTYSGNTFSGTGGGRIELDGNNLTSSVTWQNVQGMNWPYYLNHGSLTINSGVTLHIPAGLVVKSFSYGILVNGTLDAQGTADNPVVFTSYKDDAYGGDSNRDGTGSTPAGGDWSGIRINSTNTIQNVVVRYASRAFDLGSSSILLTSSQINNNLFGLYVGNVSPAITNNTFIDNVHHLSQDLNAGPTFTGNTFSANGGGMVQLSGLFVDGSVTWGSVQGMNWPYFINGYSNTTINPGATLHLPAGTIVKVWHSTIVVNGVLNAQGASDNPVVFTSYRDDSYGGDTNADGAGSSPAAGDWGGFQLNNSVSTIQSGVVHYASTAFLVTNSSSSIADSLLSENGTAVSVASGAPTIAGNTFSNNTVHLTQSVSASPGYSGNIFSGTGDRKIVLTGSSLSGAVTWQNVPGMPYYINGSLTINPSSALHLAAGTVVKVLSGAILVQGTLSTQGDDVNPVVFTSYRDDNYGGDSNADGAGSSAAASDWGGIQFRNSANAFQYAEISYASTAINVTGASPSITHTRLVNNNCAISITSGSPTFDHNQINNNSTALFISTASPSITSNSFSDNGLDLSQALDAAPTYSGNTFSGTGGGRIETSGIINGTVTWQNVQGMDWPYFVSGTLIVNNGATLHLLAGTIIKSWTNAIDVRGTLDAQGTAENPVVFTSYRDDAYGGDTNGDGSATSPAFSDWGGITISGNTTNLQYAVIRYSVWGLAGGTNISNNTLSYNATGIKVSGGSATIANNHLNNNGTAINVLNGSPILSTNLLIDNDLAIGISSGSPTVDSNQIYHNSTGIRTWSASAIITHNDISENLSYGMLKNGSGVIIAENNWWGSASGPNHATLNPSGTGNRVSDNVDFTPWSLHPLNNHGAVTITGSTGTGDTRLSYTDGGPKMITSASDGTYSINVPQFWSGAVTPSKDGYTFSPPSRSYLELEQNQAGQDYTLLVTISGSADIAGANLSYSDGVSHTILSGADGHYSFLIPKDWSGTIAPAKTGYTFNPASRSVTVSDANLPGQDFAANQIPVLANRTGLTVLQCGSAALTHVVLLVTDDNPPDQLTYTLAALPQYGTLKKNGVVLSLAATFTQAEIDSSQVSYTHDCSTHLSDTFTFSVADGLGGTIGDTAFAITVTPVSGVPLLDVRVDLHLDSGQPGTITSTYLHVADPDVPAARRIFTLTIAPAHGVLKNVGSTLAVNNAFSQADIDAGRIVYFPAGREYYSDRFTFTVSDGFGGSIGPTVFHIYNGSYKYQLYLPLIVKH